MTKTLIVRLAAGVLVSLGAWVAYTQTPQAPAQLNLQKIKDDLYMIEGDGGNVAIYTTNDGVVLIDDSFNGNPASMVAALDSLKARPMQKGRRIAILGDMLELGAEAPAYHQALAPHLSGIDGVYCVGPLMRHLYERLPAGKGL